MSRARRGLLTGLHLAAWFAVAAALVTQVDRPLAPSLPAAPPAESLFPAGFLEQVRTYRNPRYVVALAALLLSVAVPAWWARARAGRRLTARLAARAGDHRPLRAGALLALLVVLSLDLVTLPLSFWAGYVQEGQFGFRTQGLGGWIRDWLVAHAPVWCAAMLLVPLALLAVRRLPKSWPPVLGLGAGLAMTALTLLAPLLLEPLWLQTRSLPPGATRAAVEQVLIRADAPVTDIVVGDASRRTTKANAYVSGLGATRRVVLFDTLLEDMTPGEIAVVVAHEVAHDRHGDIPRGVWLGVAGGVVLAYALSLTLRAATARGRITAAADPRAVPLALAVVALLTALSLPLQSALSRHAEAAADWAALELTEDPAAFAALQHGLASSHLADPDPPAWAHWLWGSHPTARQRLAMPGAWTEHHGRRLPLAPDADS